MAEQTITAAEKACLHILRRVITSPDFRYYMLHTESLALCIAAEAERTGADADDVAERIERAIEERDRGGPAKARVLELQERVEELERGLPPGQRGDLDRMSLRLYRVQQWIDAVRLKTITAPEYHASEADLERLEELLR